MNSKQLLEWIRKPGLTGREDGAQLDALLQTYPYFQTAQLLYIKNLHNQGSFLYNNRLKAAAIYVADRKVLYDLIKRKDALDAVEETTITKIETVIPEAEEKMEIQSAPPKFPEKRFVSNPDEWEAGMLRQLQLLHHWRGKEKEEVKPKEEIHPITEHKEIQTEVSQRELPDAKDELNTLLYVLVEPGQSEDIGEENAEETLAEIESATEETRWEVHAVEDSKEEHKELQAHVEVPQDPVQQDILVEAIHSVFELEVDDTLPSVSELQTAAEISSRGEPNEIPHTQEEIDISGMTFGAWVASLKQTATVTPKPEELAEQKSAVSESGEELIARFIREEPRIHVKKSGFFNPVNMAKKSVQDSDEFVTETLARIYAKQGNIPKAVRAYQKLSLKFPEKTAYFAALIEELKRTPNK